MLKDIIKSNKLAMSVSKGTVSFTKNILAGVTTDDNVTELFENNKYGDEILSYSNLSEQFDIILSDIIKRYNSNEDILAKGYPKRCKFIMNTTIERLKRKPGPDIVATLGDFMKSSAGKEIDKVLTGAGFKDSDESYMSIVVWIAVKRKLRLTWEEITGIKEEEEEPIEIVKGEVLPLTSSNHTALEHKATSETKEEIIEEAKTVNDDKINETLENLEKLFNNTIGTNPTKENVKEFLVTIAPSIGSLIELLNDLPDITEDLDNQLVTSITDILRKSFTDDCKYKVDNSKLAKYITLMLKSSDIDNADMKPVLDLLDLIAITLSSIINNPSDIDDLGLGLLTLSLNALNINDTINGIKEDTNNKHEVIPVSEVKDETPRKFKSSRTKFIAPGFVIFA